MAASTYSSISDGFFPHLKQFITLPPFSLQLNRPVCVLLHEVRQGSKKTPGDLFVSEHLHPGKKKMLTLKDLLNHRWVIAPVVMLYECGFVTHLSLLLDQNTVQGQASTHR